MTRRIHEPRRGRSCTRRELLLGGGGMLTGLLLGACGGVTPTATLPVPVSPSPSATPVAIASPTTGCAGPGCGVTATAPPPATPSLATAPASATTVLPTAALATRPGTAITTPGATPSTAAKRLYTADFTQDWFVGEKGEPFPVQASVVPTPAPYGEYRLRLIEAGRAYTYFQIAPEGLRFGDCRIDVDLRRISGPDLAVGGLNFRTQPGIPGADTYERLQLGVRADGTWLLSYIPAYGNGMTILPRAAAAAISAGPGPNHLAILCKGNQVTVLINGQTVGSATVSLVSPGTVAPFAALGVGAQSGDPVEIGFSNLVVSELA